MNSVRQIITLTTMNLRGVSRRVGLSSVTIVGIATVVGVLISFLALGAGIDQMAARNVRPDRAVVLSGGASSSLTSSLTRDAVGTIADAPGVKKDAGGRPLMASGLMVPVSVVQRRTGLLDNTFIVGANATFGAVFPEFHIVEGRMFNPGVKELVVGRLAATQFRGLDIGDRIALRGSEWTVVGQFAENGGTWENYVAADADTVMSAFDRNAFQHVTAVLESPASFDEFSTSLSSNPSLSVDVLHESDYMLLGLGNFPRLLTFVGFFIGGVMAVGAVCGALNTMYAVVDGRRLEIATLRAIGFGAMPVVLSVLVEALALALVGAFVGAFLAWLLFNGHMANTRGMIFPLAVTPRLIRLGIIWAISIGLIGAVLPAIRAARLPIASALAGK
jgi:putative ABC transport system permease protein